MLAVTLFSFDRITLGKRIRPESWISIDRLSNLPSEIKELPLPSYIPNYLLWPPKLVLYRTLLAPGWWIHLEGKEDPRLQIWIGSSAAPFPEGMREIQGCLGKYSTVSDLHCPEAWSALSMEHPKSLDPNHVLYLISNLPQEDALRMLNSMQPLTK